MDGTAGNINSLVDARWRAQPHRAVLLYALAIKLQRPILSLYRQQEKTVVCSFVPQCIMVRNSSSQACVQATR